MYKLKIGDIAPNFIADSTSGNIELNELPNKFIILYFYPKDSTPGCTIQARDFSSLIVEFKKLDAVIFGVSKDDMISHKKFCDKENIAYPLLLDTEGSICQSYDVLKEKNMFGKKYTGIDRTTFLIDQNKKILKIWDNVSARGHAFEVFNIIKNLP